MVWAFSKTTTRVAVRNVQEVGSQLWFHLPPASPPLILLASLPRKQKLLAAAAAEGGGILVEDAIYKRLIPLVSNAFVRNLALAATGLAVTSWAHSALRRKRLLTPLALAEPYRDINRAVLPPFLPEEAPVIFLEDIVDDEDDTPELPAVAKMTAGNNDSASTDVGDDDMALPPRLRRHWKQFAEKAPKPHTIHTRLQEWRRMHRARECERKNAHRLAVFDELVALQTLRKKAAARLRRQQQQQKQWYGRFGRKSGSTETVLDDEKNMNNDSVGYALVTGASKGIGRAIAVELARWEVPLILVARDVDALTALAYDLEVCYGVNCCVLPADLSKPTTAEDIYKTVTDAGLNVDVSRFCLVAGRLIVCCLLCTAQSRYYLHLSLWLPSLVVVMQILVNNAGISSQGESLELSLDDIQRMIQVNTVSVTMLTQLFGRDMKEQGRGRILMVSSVCGAVNGIAQVAVYSATKAFENSFGTGIGKELEPHGVGVTCLMPGAVRDTEFQARSNSHEALAWKIPGYTKTAPFVAECGVRAMLRGDTEVTPGLMNRLFLKVLKPILPQRLHNLVAEIAWSPLHLPFDLTNKNSASMSDDESAPAGSVADRPPFARTRSSPLRTPYPRLLQLQVSNPEPEPAPTVPDREESSSSIETSTDGSGNDGTITTTAAGPAPESGEAIDQSPHNSPSHPPTATSSAEEEPSSTQTPAISNGGGGHSVTTQSPPPPQPPSQNSSTPSVKQDRSTSSWNASTKRQTKPVRDPHPSNFGSPPSVEETTPNAAAPPPTAQNSLTVAEQVLKDFQKGRDTMSSLLDKALAE